MEPAAVADGPDPSDDEATSEPLADSVKESVLVVLLADTGREHGAESGPEDVEDEHGETGQTATCAARSVRRW